MIYILVALESEFSHTEPDHRFTKVYTGVGKVNAAIAATEICLRYDCDSVINFGTAGTLKPELAGQLLKIGSIRQRDMDGRPQAPLGITPFEYSVVKGDIILDSGIHSLSTGDNFVQSSPELYAECVDMEAYAIAKACHRFKKPFSCYKYITDLADENAAKTWEALHRTGSNAFYNKLYGELFG